MAHYNVNIFQIFPSDSQIRGSITIVADIDTIHEIVMTLRRNLKHYELQEVV